MGLEIEYIEGQTPLDEDEKEGLLIKSITSYGRHSRLIADIIISQISGKPVFNWSSSNLNKKGEARTNYLTAIRLADIGDIKPLIFFAKT